MTGRCISGSWLGPEHHCVHPAVPNLLGDPMFCAACEASIAGLGPLCDCPGCARPYVEEPPPRCDALSPGGLRALCGRPVGHDGDHMHIPTGWSWPQPTTKGDPMSEIRCPKCGSDDVTCTSRPHIHNCNACGYNGLRPKIEIYPHHVAEGTDLEHGFRLKAGNGEIIMHGEGYARPSTAEDMARAIVIDGSYSNARVLYVDRSGTVLDEKPTAPREHVTDGSRCWCDPQVEVVAPAELPTVWEDEEGGVWWAKGHHHPAAMALAVVADVAAQVGADDARNLVAPDVDELDAEAEGVKPGRHPERANDLLRNVHHVWMRPDPANPDERIVPATTGDPDAAPWTQLELV